MMQKCAYSEIESQTTRLGSILLTKTTKMMRSMVYYVQQIRAVNKEFEGQIGI